MQYLCEEDQGVTGAFEREGAVCEVAIKRLPFALGLHAPLPISPESTPRVVAEACERGGV
jgi:hypothetical protein